MMTGAVSVTVDLERGEVVLGSHCVRLEPAGQPYRFRLSGGAVVRAVTFEERSRAVREALIAPDPPEALVSALRGLATEAAPDGVIDAVVLALAGGSEEVPGFDECAVAAARAHGWDWSTLNQAPAIEVDRALAAAPEATQQSGWMRFVFAGGDVGDADQALSEMAERLLDRGIGRRSERHSGEAEPRQPKALTRPAGEAHFRSENTFEPASHPATAKVPVIDRASHLASSSPRFRLLGRRVDAPAAWPAPSGPSSPPAEEAPPTQATSGAPVRARVELKAVDASHSPERRTSRVSVRVLEPTPSAAPSARPVHLPPPGMDSTSGAVALPRAPLAYATPGVPWASSVASSTPAPALARPAEPAPQAKRPASQPAAEQHDWLAEIARALADECDLRGIDA